MFSEVEGWEFWKPTEFRRQFLAGTLEKFDFVFTYSSLEHSGLGINNREILLTHSITSRPPGRYGDPLNPWGDLMAVGEAWCVASEGAKMAIGVPTTRQPEGVLAFNAHRIYGTLNYPYLVGYPFKWNCQLNFAKGFSIASFYCFSLC